ncbi:MAG: hypothetical protein RLZZ214_4192 [Verrucomicrobiota bacterium]|jgi:hypothetical protein
MSCNHLAVTLPDVFQSETWDGITWAIESVDAGETEFASTLASARFQMQDTSGNVALDLTSATEGQVTINESAPNAWSVTVEPRILTLSSGVYSWGFETTDSAGVVKIRLAGSIKIKGDLVI